MLLHSPAGSRLLPGQPLADPRPPGMVFPRRMAPAPRDPSSPSRAMTSRAPALHWQLPPGWYLTSSPCSQARGHRARIGPPQFPGWLAAPSPSGVPGAPGGTGAGTPPPPSPYGATGTEAPGRRGSAALPVGFSGGMLPARAARSSSSERGSAAAVSCVGSARHTDGKGSPMAAGRGRMLVPRGGPRSGRAGGSGAGPGEGAAVLLPFCTPGLRDPHAWLFPSLNKVSPTGSGGGKKGRGWGWRGGWSQAGPRPPGAHPRAASPQPPAAPPRLPRRRGEARKRVQEKGNPISDRAGEAFK